MAPSDGVEAHDHDCDGSDCGLAYSLYKEIDLPQA